MPLEIHASKCLRQVRLRLIGKKWKVSEWIVRHGLFWLIIGSLFSELAYLWNVLIISSNSFARYVIRPLTLLRSSYKLPVMLKPELPSTHGQICMYSSRNSNLTIFPGAASYVVTVINEETGESYEVDVGSSLTMDATDLLPGTKYSFTVRGENRQQNLRSNESRKVIQHTYPEAPKVEIVSFNPFSISVSWNQVKGQYWLKDYKRLITSTVTGDETE